MTAIRFEDARAHAPDTRRSSARTPVAGTATRMITRLGHWRRRSRDRAQLARLDDRMLADIGISRAEAEFLVNKPFWRE
ncbi:MAG: DUF1127 domain-containing protein [Stellaceae bacterium]